jgi:hypothetical protein
MSYGGDVQGVNVRGQMSYRLGDGLRGEMSGRGGSKNSGGDVHGQMS